MANRLEQINKIEKELKNISGSRMASARKRELMSKLRELKSEKKPNKPRTIAEAKRLKKPYYYNKAGKKLAAVTKEELAASGAKDLTAYLNQQKGLTRRGPVPKTRGSDAGRSKKDVTPLASAAAQRGQVDAADAGRKFIKERGGLEKKDTTKNGLEKFIKERGGLKKFEPGILGKVLGFGSRDPKTAAEDTYYTELLEKRDSLDGLTPSEQNYIDTFRKRSGGKVISKKKKKKKQGYKARKDESIAMRVKKKRTKKQLQASRDESYGKWGSKKGKGKINKSSGSSLVASLYD